MRTLIGAVALLATLGAPCAAAGIRPAAVDAVVAKAMEASGTPGVSIAIVQHGRIVYAKGYGLASLATHEPVTAATSFAIGSISKQFLASEVMLLRAQGRIALRDTLAKYCPHFLHGQEITIADLLSHESGVRDYYPLDYNTIAFGKPTTMAAITARASREPLDFAPRTQWQYSNTGYSILGTIVERITGKTLAQLYREHFFSPLGMASARWNDIPVRLPSEAVGYSSFFLAPDEVAVPEGAGWRNAAGALVMTAPDLARWTLGLMNHTVLSPSETTLLWTSRKLRDGSDPHYGFGFFVSHAGTHLVVEHSGGTAGFSSEEVILPGDRSAVIALTNDDDGTGSVIARAILPMLIGSLPATPHPSSPATPAPSFERGLAPASDITLAWLRALAGGRVDREQMTTGFNAFMTPQRIASAATSLARLGLPLSARRTESGLRGGLVVDALEVRYPHKTLLAVLYRQPADGKIAELFVYPE